jgi:hypothetical protein
MTHEHDGQTRIVVSWLREDAHENAERVLLAALNDIDHTQQRRPWWPAWRFADMNNVAKVLVATAAVVAVAVAGINILPRTGTGPGAVPPSPSPTASPSATPQPTVAQVPSSGPIEAGTYVVTDGQSAIRITIPAGWTAADGGLDIRKNRDQPDEVMFAVWRPDIHVFADACATGNPPPSTGPSADDLVAALRAQVNSAVSEPSEITIGGRPGLLLQVGIPEGFDMAGCTDGIVRVWSNSTDQNLAFTEGGNGRPGTSVYIVQAASGRFVFGTGREPQTTAADLAELQAIIGSIQFEPAP